ncbi:MAG: hypothetical protein LZF60_70083 [Nitrospira sp.]|nr:MAG: hypothetical protein LZF60_70083 [Nitrospira sp.]
MCDTFPEGSLVEAYRVPSKATVLSCSCGTTPQEQPVFLARHPRVSIKDAGFVLLLWPARGER